MRSPEENRAYNAGWATNRMEISDKDLHEIIKYHKLTLAYLEGMNGDGNFFGLVTSRLRQELERYEGFREARKNGVKDYFENGECPDCKEDISKYAVEGDECSNCGHVFWISREEKFADDDVF